MKISHITVRANVAWGEYQHVRVEIRMELDKHDGNRTKKDLRLEVANFVEDTLDTLVCRLRKVPNPEDDTNPELQPV